MKLRSVKRADGALTFFVDYYHNGKRRRKRLEGIHDRETARTSFADFVGRFARGQANLPTHEGLTIGKALDALIASKRATCTEAHAVHLDAAKAQIVGHFGEDTPVSSLTERHVNEFRQARRGKGDCPGTINRKTVLLRTAAEKAVRAGMIAKNPLAGLVALSDPGREVWRWLREKDAAALLGVLLDGTDTEVKREGVRGNYTAHLGKSLPLWRLCMVLLNTGARLGEALALRWADVDLARGILSLHTTKHAARGRKAKPRHIPINGALREALEAMPCDGERVLTIPSNNLHRKFERACELAKIGHCRIHDLRHTFASHLVLNGTPLNTVRELLGHATMTMTLRYAHLAPEATAKAVETLAFGASNRGAEVVQVGAVAG